MDPLVPFLLAVGAGFAYMSTLAPPPPPAMRQRQYADVVDTKSGGGDNQPTVGFTRAVDDMTGLPILWVHKRNGTRHKVYLSAADGTRHDVAANTQK